jgi:hypothetical protein
MLRFLMIYGVFASMGAMACTPPSVPAPVQPKAAPPLPPKPPAPRCGSHVLMSSKEAMAQTPRPDVDAERLAVRVSKELVAAEGDYTRIKADLKAIRAFAKGDPGAKRTWPRLAVQSVTLQMKPKAIEALRSGTYKGFDCLNAWYGGTLAPVASSIDLVFINFKGWYHGKQIAKAYRGLPDIIFSEPSAVGGAGDDISLCNERVGGTHRYRFSHGSGDCLAGCIDWVYRGYEVTPTGEVRRLEPDWKKSGLEPPTEPPAWAQAGCFRKD